ncbi:hypothetical protein [uncultured Methylobacterium sp.]|jgi:hypothetical protein|uniref:hypothetical protein n=1 Tax=uncultured Methylobacterium sp. TaxID=157278 RepID=UPI0026078E4F|nr:hypothetical protein [uncultured Methylobacterium sp.]
MTAPTAFGLVFDGRGKPHVNQRRIPTVHFSTPATDAFVDAVSVQAVRSALFDAGYYNYAGLGRGLGRAEFVLRHNHDLDALAAAITMAEAAIPAVREARLAAAAEASERKAAQLLETRARVGAIAERVLSTIPWAIQTSEGLALLREAVTLETWTEAYGTDVANEAHGAERVVAQTRKRLRVPVGIEMGNVRDPVVSAAALEAVGYVSALDGDWALHRNKSGWGKPSSAVGHVLAAEDALDEIHASHALRILRIHRRQLPAALAARLFAHAAVAA